MNRNRTAAVLASLLLLLAVRPILAQAATGPRVGLSQTTRGHGLRSVHPFKSDSVPATRWKEGMFIGGGLGVLVGGAITGYALSTCGTPDCHTVKLTYFLVPIVVLAILGGMIGDASHKK